MLILEIIPRSKPSSSRILVTSEILKATKEEAPSILSPRGDNRSGHYMRLKALLYHFRDDIYEINADMSQLFIDLLTRENWELISAYELYLLNDDKDDMIDTLFVVYKLYSGNAEIVGPTHAGRRRHCARPEEAQRVARDHPIRLQGQA